MRSKLRGDFRASLKMPFLDAPAEPRHQPARQAPCLNHGVRSVLDANLAQGLGLPRPRGGIERLSQNPSPIFQPPPLQIGPPSPTTPPPPPPAPTQPPPP